MAGADTALRVKVAQRVEARSSLGSSGGLCFLCRHDDGGSWADGVKAILVTAEGKQRARWSRRRLICWT